MNTEVSLRLTEREFVRKAADNCHEANKAKFNIPDYDPRRFNLTGQQANRLGKFAEAVAFKWLGGNVLHHTLEEWAHYVPNDHPDYDRLVKGQVDLNINGLRVEVRRANALHSPIPVRAKDRQEGVVVLQVYVPYTQQTRGGPIIVNLNATILGWAWADDAGTTPSWAKQAGTLVVDRRSMDTFPQVGEAA